MFKKTLKILSGTLFGLMILPYFLPREFSTPIPGKPYENSVFFTTEEGIRLHGQFYPAQGESLGKILLVHGLGASTFSFRHNAPVFAQAGYDVLAVDLPAFGYSDKSAGIDHSQVERAGYLWQWLKAYDQRENDSRPWHLTGHSMGGSAILAMANQKPDRVASLNLIAGMVTKDVPHYGWMMSTPHGEWTKVVVRTQVITPKIVGQLLAAAYNRTPDETELAGYLIPLQTKGTVQALADFVKTSKNVLITELIPQNIPINLFWGSQDNVVKAENIPLIQAAVKVHETVVFENEGHCVHETAPTFNAEFLRVLNPLNKEKFFT